MKQCTNINVHQLYFHFPYCGAIYCLFPQIHLLNVKVILKSTLWLCSDSFTSHSSPTVLMYENISKESASHQCINSNINQPRSKERSCKLILQVQFAAIHCGPAITVHGRCTKSHCRSWFCFLCVHYLSNITHFPLIVGQQATMTSTSRFSYTARMGLAIFKSSNLQLRASSPCGFMLMCLWCFKEKKMWLM